MPLKTSVVKAKATFLQFILMDCVEMLRDASGYEGVRLANGGCVEDSISVVSS